MLKRVYFAGACLVSWLIFGVCAVLCNFLCALLLVLPARQRCSPLIAEILRWFFIVWTGWLRLAGLIRVHWHGFEAETLRGPVVCVANHPGLLDAVFLLARLPGAVCVFKRKLLRNPLLAPAAIMAGYPRGDVGAEFIHNAVRHLAGGRPLLIFPEGTRTATGAVLNPFKPGFALIAARAGVPVQLIVIRANRQLLPRERAWWQMPQFPVTVEICVDARLTIPSEADAHSTAALVEGRFAEALHQPIAPAAFP